MYWDYILYYPVIFLKKYTSTRIACYNGYIVQAAINNLLPLFYAIIQRDFQITVERLGALTAVNFITQFVVDLLAVRYADRIGWRRCICASHVLAVAGFVMLAFLPGIIDPYTAVVLSVIVYASGSAVIEVMVSPIIDALPSSDKGGQMALLHSFYCWGQLGVVLLSTLALSLFGEEIWTVLPLAWALVPAVNFFLFIKVPLVIPERDESERAGKGRVKRLFSLRIFCLFMLLMLCAGAAEQAMSQWASYFAESALGVTKLAGDLLGVCMFAFFMGLGRVLFFFVGRRVTCSAAVMFCSALCVICYCTAGFSVNAYVSLAACALTGLSVSLMWPCVFSLAAERIKDGGTAMFALLAVCGDIGCAAGPALLGLLAGSFGLKSSLPAIAVFPLFMLCALFIMNKTEKRRS